MNRKAILCTACLIGAAIVGFVWASGPGSGKATGPRSAWTLTVTLPVSNATTAVQTNRSPLTQ